MARYLYACLFALCCCSAVADVQDEPGKEDAWAAAVAALNAKNFNAKVSAANALIDFEHPQVKPIFEAWQAGLLYQRRSDQSMVLVADHDDGFLLRDAVTGDTLGTAKKSEIKKITINNVLRKRLRQLLANLNIKDEDPRVRLAAARQFRQTMDPGALALLHEVDDTEQDADVRSVIDEILALKALAEDNAQQRLAAIDTLRSSLRLQTRDELMAVSENDHENDLIRKKARLVADRITMKRDLYAVAETAFFGLSLGSVLVLAAIGLAITFGVMGVINMAHGELIMIGAYTAYVMQLLLPGQVGVALLLAVPVAFLVSGGLGVLLEQGVIRFLYGRPLETLLATFGVSLVLQQLARSIFSPLNRPVSTPDWMSGTLQINDAFAITYSRLYILIFSLLVFFTLLLIVKNTKFGLQLRATSQNRPMAKAMGIRSNRVDALTFGLGAGVAGIAGVGLSQLTNVGPNMGQAYIIDSFMVIIFGGTGNLWGTLYAGMVLGLINKVFEPYAGAMLAKIIVLVFIILFIQKKPRGMFPQTGRAVDG